MKNLFFAAVVLSLVACGGSQRPTVQEQSAEAQDNAGRPLVAPGDAQIGDRTTCPASGEEFVVNSGSPHVEYQGKTYYFCCAGCARRFQENPDGFLRAQ